MLGKVHEYKEKEIKDVKDQLYQAKEDTVQEYRDSDAHLAEFGNLFMDGFDDCFHQVKASFPDLYLSCISIDLQAQTPTQPVYFESTNELFADDTIADPQDDRKTSPID